MSIVDFDFTQNTFLAQFLIFITVYPGDEQFPRHFVTRMKPIAWNSKSGMRQISAFQKPVLYSTDLKEIFCCPYIVFILAVMTI